MQRKGCEVYIYKRINPLKIEVKIHVFSWSFSKCGLVTANEAMTNFGGY